MVTRRALTTLLTAPTVFIARAMSTTSPSPLGLGGAAVPWALGAKHAKAFVPELSEDLHKGSCGRIAVFGGSAEYTGAPFYAATSALKVGADLSFVLTAEEAAIPIKCYGPELMVFPMYSIKAFDAAAAEDAAAAAASSSSNERSSSSGTSKVDELVDAAVDAMSSMILGRMHGVLLGPGLGRHPAVLRVAAGVVQRCVGAGIPLVIDADGLYLISQQPALVAGGGNKVLLTPNPVEFKRLRDAVLPSGATAAPADCTSGDASAPLEQVSTPAPGVKTGFSGEAAAELRAVSAALGAAVLRKGKHDAIVGSEAGDGAKALLVVEGEHGSPRRSGGMGDLLAGAAVVFLTWAHRMSPPAGGHEARESSAARDALAEAPPALWAAWTACVVVKRSAAAAFAKHGRSTTAPDVLAEVGPEVGKLFPLESP